MRKFLLIFIFVWQSCTDKIPEPKCSTAGKFIMHLQNEKGRVMQDSVSKHFYILFSVGQSLNFNAVAVPCDLPLDFKTELNVLFEADFFEYKGDSLHSVKLPLYAATVKNIEYY